MGEGLPLPAKGPKGTFEEDEGQGDKNMYVISNDVDHAGLHLEFCSPNIFSF